MSNAEEEKEEIKEDEKVRKRSKTILLSGIAVIFCLILGGIWAIAFYHGKKAIEQKCSQAYSQAQEASRAFESERASSMNIRDTSSAKASQAYLDLKKALDTKTDSSPVLCSAGTHEAIEANEALIKTLGSKQENIAYLSARLLVQENASNLTEEKAAAEKEIEAAKNALPALPPSSKTEAESRISDLQNELDAQNPSLAGIKDAMLALEGSLKTGK
ncbi:MAG: hypothetical protein IKT06_03520 [Aeriscardovia sp.]|nr:hypothetical protein [Aeriscardovia sp.]